MRAAREIPVEAYAQRSQPLRKNNELGTVEADETADLFVRNENLSETFTTR